MVLPVSSGSPVSDGNLLLSLHDMVNRRTRSGALMGPDGRLTVYEAVGACSLDPRSRWDSKTPRHDRVGQLADLFRAV